MKICNGVITVRKVVLNMIEQNKYEIIKNLVETDGNKDRAAMKIGCSRRHINRLLKDIKLLAKHTSYMVTAVYKSPIHSPMKLDRT